MIRHLVVEYKSMIFKKIVLNLNGDFSKQFCCYLKVADPINNFLEEETDLLQMKMVILINIIRTY